MNEYAPLHKTAMDILEEALLKFHLPSAMNSFKEAELKQMARLVWALQIIVKELIEYTDEMGNPQDFKDRLDRVERYITCSKGILTSEEVCEMLDISISHLYYIVRNKGLRIFKPTGKLMFFRVKDVVEWSIANPGRNERPIEKTGLLKTTNHEQPTATTADSAGLSPAE